MQRFGARDIDEVAYVVVNLQDSEGKVIPIGKWEAHLTNIYLSFKTQNTWHFIMLNRYCIFQINYFIKQDNKDLNFMIIMIVNIKKILCLM